jgi:hypothetical protein
VWLDRYRRGEHRGVWTDMTSAGAAARSDPDAVAVVAETMRRIRENVERLVRELPARGFVFRDERPHTPPPADVAAQLDELEGELGPMPLSLRVFFEQVGLVNLNGTHPEWTFDYPDPLVIEAPIDYIRSEFEEWSEDRYTETFELPLAPDFLHKANVSGGNPYSLAVPNDGVDGLLLWEPHQTTFVNYLRIAFAAGGMPVWFQEPGQQADWARPQDPPPGWLLELAGSLDPI